MWPKGSADAFKTLWSLRDAQCIRVGQRDHILVRRCSPVWLFSIEHNADDYWSINAVITQFFRRSRSSSAMFSAQLEGGLHAMLQTSLWCVASALVRWCKKHPRLLIRCDSRPVTQISAVEGNQSVCTLLCAPDAVLAVFRLTRTFRNC